MDIIKWLPAKMTHLMLPHNLCHFRVVVPLGAQQPQQQKNHPRARLTLLQSDDKQSLRTVAVRRILGALNVRAERHVLDFHHDLVVDGFFFCFYERSGEEIDRNFFYVAVVLL